MVHSQVDSVLSERVRKRVYLPDVDEFKSSSGPLSEVVLESLDGVSNPRAKPLKQGYVADLTREGGISPCSVILGLLYIHRLSEANPRYLRSMSGKDLFLTAMMIASKYLNDEGESEALTNSEWADVGCKSKATLDSMERKFLAAIDWKLYVSLDDYYYFVTGIEGRIALKQFAARGWLTYTDLVTVWDTMDTQRALLTATKHVAKVTCGSAAVYLVLLSTLLTASHALHSTWAPPSSLTPSSSTNTNTSSTGSQLESAATALMNEPDLVLESYRPAHWEYPHHYERFLKHKPPNLKHHVNRPGRAVTILPTLDAHQPDIRPDPNRHKTSHITSQQLKHSTSTRHRRLHSLEYCGVIDPECRRMEIDNNVRFSERFLWLGSIDLHWWPVLSRGTRSISDHNGGHYRSNSYDGMEQLSLLATEWITYSFSLIKTFGKLLLDGLATSMDFAEIFDPFHNSSLHTSKYALSAALPMFYGHLAGDIQVPVGHSYVSMKLFEGG